MAQRHAPAAAAPRQVDASMTLLNELQQRPLDPGYAEAAARRAARAQVAAADPAGRPGVTWVGWVVIVVVAAALGVGVAAAATALRQPTADDRQARQLLESQVRDHRDEVTQLTAANAQLAAEVSALQQDALRAQDPALLATTRQWSVAAGTAPVTGPGLRVVLSDAPGVVDDPENLDLRVQDVDLQVLVNGLWAAGAEAIAINGQRVAATTAIRSAGSAVLVDLVPLVGPYTVDAIGDAADLQTKLALSAAGQHVAMLHATYGIGLDITSQPKLQLPGSGAMSLSAATVPADALARAGLAPAPVATVVPESGPSMEGKAP
ncbi:MAG TPA: DUF881 domain-containing protein [Cellulomonas sp.]